jgi:hypothetical protein
MNLGQRKKAAILTASFTAAASLWAISPAVLLAGTSTNTKGTVQQGQSDGGTGTPSLNNPAVTISFAGQTALKNFFTSAALTELQPGTSIILHDGTNNSAVTYIAPSDPSTTVQLASKSFTTADKNPGTVASPSTNDLQVASALRVEWHQEGSVDGFVDLLNDEVGYNQTSGPISNESLRGPSSSNPTTINQTSFTAYNTSSSTGLNIAASYANGISGATGLSQTYNALVYNQSTGTNIQGGQNRVQFSIGEYPTEGLAVSGTASPFASAGAVGYGQGNPALKGVSNLTALGTGGARQQFQPVSAANESTDKIDPNTGAAYTTGPWNTAGADNITSTSFAVTAVTYSANPGTGLQRLDKGDSQWLQTTGRLQNGALFNVVARTVNTGQRVVFALNTGVDPSWAVGSNDDGNSTSSANATAQHSVGPSLRFDGKTSGSEAAATIGAGRMAVGALSVPEASGNSSNVAPVRALDIDFTDQNDVNSADDALSANKFIRANFNTIVSDGSVANGPHYAATLISHVNTVKNSNAAAATALAAYEAANPTLTPAQAWAALPSFDPNEGTYTGASLDKPAIPVSGIKGDTYGDVGALLSNLVTSTGTASGNTNLSSPSLNNPADGLFATGYLIPQLLDYTRQADGNAITPVTLSASALSEQSQVGSNYGFLFTTDNTSGANNQTIGTGAYYGTSGNVANNPNGVAVNGAIPITAKDASGNAVSNYVIAAGGNYLFGNFNQNGVRDLSSVEQGVNAALSLYATDGAKNSIFTADGGVVNSTVVPSLYGTPGWVTTSTNTKGDLIALGDYNGDGKFDGADLYEFAIGASLTSAGSTTGLNATATTFADVVRDPTDVLRKNAALAYINNYLTNYASYNASSAGALFLRQTGAAVLTAAGITTAAGVPRNATALNTTDPITGYEQFTYDPNGANAFNAADVNRDGVVDFNDALLVDQYNGQSYSNLTQSLAATEPAPVSGTVQPLSLVVVQQVDGESAIGSADLSAINTQLSGTGNTNWYAYNVTKSGPGTITWARTGGTVTVYNGAALQVSSGSVQVSSTIDPFTDSTVTGVNTSTGSSVAISVTSGGKLEYSNQPASGYQIDRLASVNISSGGVVALDPSTTGHHSLLIAGSVTVAAGGKLDLGNNDLDVQSGLLTSFNAAALAGQGSGNWNGSSGLTSAAAFANSSHLTAVGVIQNNQSGSALFTASNTFDGVTPGAGDILAKYTYYGDADLNGKVDGTDYSRIDNGYLHGLSGWLNGDFNYDGIVDGSDYTLIDNAYNSQGTVISSEIADPTVSIAAEIGGASTTSAVPEPVGMGMLAFAGAGLLGRRKRK